MISSQIWRRPSADIMGGLLSILAVALAPVILLFTYLYVRDRYQREPIWLLGLLFFLGIVIAFPVLITGILIAEYTGIDDPSPLPLAEKFLFCVFAIGLVEEGFKYLVLRWVAYPMRHFNEPYDGIMFAAAVSLGFAAIENVLYVMDSGLGTGLFRMFTAVPGHAMFAVLMGFFVGLSKFKPRGIARMLWRWTGLFAATLVHGLYDFFLFAGNFYVVLLAFAVLLIGIFLAMKAIRYHQRRSPLAGGAQS